MTTANCDRRRFLASSSAVVLGTAMQAAADDGANRPPVRIAVVGTGARGSDLIRKLTTIEQVRLIGVCDDYAPHLARGSKYAGPDAATFTSFTKMLRETQPDAVVVATPLWLHYEMCMQALEAGAAVFCEKLMCHQPDQARQLAAAVSEKRAVFQVGLQRRANAIYNQAAAMAAAGMLGKITAIKCQWHRNNNWRRPVPVERSDPAWQALEHRLNWRLYWDYSQGLMAELASHQLDVVNRLLGCAPRRVLASGGVDHWQDGREVYDNVFCVYEYELPDGPLGKTRPAPAPAGAGTGTSTPTARAPHTVRVTYSSLQNNAYEGASELIMGTRGTLFLTQQKGLFYREGSMDDPGWSREREADRDADIITSGKTLKMTNDPWAHRGTPYEIDTASDDSRDELLAFVRAVSRKDPQTICSAQVGLENTITVLAGNEAIRTGSPVEIRL